jgi:translation initiation factor RLI1
VVFQDFALWPQDLESQYRLKHLQRILKERKESVKTHEVHMELMDLLKPINVYAGNIAKTILTSGEAQRVRIAAYLRLSCKERKTDGCTLTGFF